MKKVLYISLLINGVLLLLGAFALHRLGGIKNIKYRIANRGLSKLYEHRKNHFSQMPGRDSSIVFLGDSITELCEWSELLNSDNILNRGISGDHCDGVRERLKDVKKLNPSKIFLMIGVNDLAFHPAKKVIEKYQRLIFEIKNKLPHATLYLESVLPVNNIVSPLPMQNEDVDELNEGIKKIAAENKLTYINLHSLLLDSDGNLHAQYTQDGIHLNGKGYMVLKNELQSYVSDN